VVAYHQRCACPEPLTSHPVPGYGDRRGDHPGGMSVTGSVVRVTGSGLGCPSWPQCFPGSLVPKPHPDVAAPNQGIEFGNRLLTGLVGPAGLARRRTLSRA